MATARTVAAASALLFVALLAVAAQAHAATVTDLGNFLPMSVNSSDQIAGDVEDLNSDSSTPEAGVWIGGTLTQLPELADTQTSDAYEINAAGQIVGDDQVADPGLSVHGATWNLTGPITQLGPFFNPAVSGDDFTVAEAIDSAGDIVGTSPTAADSCGGGAFLYQSGTVTPVGSCSTGVVDAIAAGGSTMLTAVGGDYYLVPTATPAATGTLLDITPSHSGAELLGGSEWGAYMQNDVSSDGAVLGYKNTSTNMFVRLPTGSEVPVTGLQAGNAINASHDVVGTILNNTTAIHAAMWEPNGTVVDLNSLLPPNSGYILLDALAINDNGDIVGLADSTATGTDVGFLLKSAPRTSATALVCTPAADKTLTCTAKVTDTTGDGSVQTPTGTVQFTATAGLLATPSCTLSAVSGGAACSDTYTPASSGTTTGSVQITASYVGDSNFQPSTGSFAVCANGAPLGLDSVSSTVPHPDGFRIGSQVVLHGCGFQAGMKLIWGASAAVSGAEEIDDPTSISADGATATVTVPWEATTGTITVVDDGNKATLDGQDVDSWRNTEGLSFKNYGGLTTRQQFENAFATPVTNGQASINGQPILLPRYETFYSAHNNTDGFCYGFAYLTGQKALGGPPVDGKDPYQFDIESVDSSTIQSDWWKQYSDENGAFRREDYQSAAQVRAALGSDPWTSPSIVELFWSTARTSEDGHQVTTDHGHAVLAFAVQDTSSSSPHGDFTIYTYNSNDPFTADEEDGVASNHATALQRSNVAFAADGTWSFPEFKLAGFHANSLNIEPVSQLTGPLHLLQAVGLTGVVGANTSVVSASGPTGAPVDLAPGTSDGVTVVPQSDGTSTATSSNNPGASGISEILGPEGHWRETLANDGGPVSAAWYTPSLAATIQASHGQDAVDFDPRHDTLAVGPATGANPSSGGTISLISGAAGHTERVLTVTGPLTHAHAAIKLTGNGATLAATTGGTFSIVLSTAGPHTPGQSFVSGPIRLTAGQKVTLTPASWTGLGGTTVSAAFTGAGRRHTARLRNHLHARGARVASAKLKGRTLAVTLATERVDLQTTAIRLTVSVRHHGRTIISKTVPFVLAKAKGHTVTIPLSKPVPDGASARITVQTSTGGIAPTTATTTRTIKLHG